MTDAAGPLYPGGLSSGRLLFLPDVHNDLLQQEGKPPVYYWLPHEVRLARKNGADGDYKFSFLHFVGVMSGETHVGVSGTDEVAGGLLAFSTTSAPPPEQLLAAQEDVKAQVRGSGDRFLGWRLPGVEPIFRPAPVVSNTTSVTNLTPGADGSLPAPSGGGAAPGGPGAGNGGPPPSGPPGQRGLPPEIVPSRRPALATMPRSVPLSRGYRDSNLDAWAFQLQGQGPGSVTPFAENAYSALVGSIPAAVLWGSFHGGSSILTVWQAMKIKVWTPVIKIHMEADWRRVQSHLSAQAKGGWWWWSADLKAEFNNTSIGGGIKMKITVDPTVPGAEQLQQQLEKRTDLLFTKFMEQAQKIIFDPPAFNEKPAEASGGFLGLGGGVAFKLRRDSVSLHQTYDEEREMAYLQDYPISGTMSGIADEIKADPAAEKKYFQTVYLGDWNRKVSTIVKPVVNWPAPDRQWVGEPVAFLSAQVGYPNTEGVVQWHSHLFQRADDPAVNWTSAVEMKRAAEVKGAPAGWTPDKVFLKRKIHFTEPPAPGEFPFVQMAIEKNVVDLDPGEYGTLVESGTQEVRVDEVGRLAVGPISLNIGLTDASQVVEVTFQAEGKAQDGSARPPFTFRWTHADQETPRFWYVFTGDPEYVPRFTYTPRVIVKGTLFARGQEWTGPAQTVAANGPLMVSVPQSDGEGVVKRGLSMQRIKALLDAAPRAVTSGAPASPAPGASAPPSSRPPAYAAESKPPPSSGSRPPAYAHAGGSRPPSSGGKKGAGAGGTATSGRTTINVDTRTSEIEGWGLTPPQRPPRSRGNGEKENRGENVFEGFSPIPPGS
jgi:hypothetical protein